MVVSIILMVGGADNGRRDLSGRTQVVMANQKMFSNHRAETRADNTITPTRRRRQRLIAVEA
jgi:hypothetical protein